jgi:hypothetical protein
LPKSYEVQIDAGKKTMNPKVVFGVVGGFVAVFSLSQIACAQQADPHGWLGTESLKTHFGDFQFKDGYPVGDTPLAARGRGCGTSTVSTALD